MASPNLNFTSFLLTIYTVILKVLVLGQMTGHCQAKYTRVSTKDEGVWENVGDHALQKLGERG